jgi:hypothetical protein
MRKTAHAPEVSVSNRRLPAMQQLRAYDWLGLVHPFAALYNLKLPIYSWAE